jgi:hypothetical protein
VRHPDKREAEESSGNGQLHGSPRSRKEFEYT